MPEDYRIVWRLDDGPAQAAMKRGAAGMAALEKASLRAANAIEAALTAAARAAGAVGAAASSAAAAQEAGTGRVARAHAKARDGAAGHARAEAAAAGTAAAAAGRAAAAREQAEARMTAAARAGAADRARAADREAADAERAQLRRERGARTQRRRKQRIAAELEGDVYDPDGSLAATRKARADALRAARSEAGSPQGVRLTRHLTRQEGRALYGYSGADYRTVNASLRGTSRPEDAAEAAQVAAQARALDRAVAKGRIAAATTLYRGTSLSALGLTGAPAVGHTLTDPGFVSTSRSRDIAERFGRDVLLEIRARKGLAAADVSHHAGGHEQEVLLGRGLQYRVAHVVAEEAGRHRVIVDAIDPVRQELARQLRADRAARLSGGGAGTPTAGTAGAAAGGEETPHIDVGLHKLQVDTIKAQDRRAAAAEKATARANEEARKEVEYREKLYDRAASDEHARDLKAAQDRVKAAEKAEAEKQRLYDRAATDEHDREVKAAQAAKREADKEVAYRQRLYDKALSDEHARDLKAAQSKLTAAEKAEAQKQRLYDKAAADEHDRALKAAQTRQRLEEGPAGRAATYRRRELSEAEAHAVALNRITDVHNKRRIEGIARVMGEERLSFAEAINSALGLESALTRAGLAAAGLGAAKAILGAIAGAMADAKRASEDMARQVLDTASGLREIVAIKGRFAPTDEDVARHAAVRAASGLTQGEAVAFEAELQNVLGTVGKAKFPEAERDKLAVSGAQLAARTGGGEAGATTRARIMGLVADFVKPGPGGKVRSEDVIAMSDAIDVINSLGAASQTVSTAQSAKLLTALTTEGLTGSFHDPRKAVALSTIGSKFEPDASATAALEAIRQARGFTKFRKTPGTTASQAATLKAAGITETMDPAESMRALFQFAQKEMKPEEAFDAFMARRGFRDQTGNLRLMQFYNEYLKGNFDRVMAEASKPIEAGAPEAKFAEFRASDVGRDLIGKARVDAAKAERGKLSRELLLQKQGAEEEHIRHGGEESIMGRLYESAVGAFGLGGISGREAVLEREAVKRARAAAGLPAGSGLGRAGLVAGTVTATNPLLFPLANPAATAAQYLLGGNAEVVRELKSIAASNAEMAKADRAKAPAPAPPPLPIGAAPGAPLRP